MYLRRHRSGSGEQTYEYWTLVKSVRDGAQYVARYGGAAGIFPSDMSAAEGIATNLVVYGSPVSTGSKLLSTMDPNDVKFTYSPATPRTYVQVTATFEFQPLFGIIKKGTKFSAQIRMKELGL